MNSRLRDSFRGATTFRIGGIVGKRTNINAQKDMLTKCNRNKI